MKFNKYLTLFLITIFGLFAVATGIPQKFATDILQIGNGNNGDPKEIIFNNGSGSSNARISSDSVTGAFTLNKDTNVTGNNLTLGDGANTAKIILFDAGNGANNPQLKYNETKGALEFTNDGTLFNDIGSGAGGAQEQNLLQDLNPDFENGLLSWNTVGGSLTLETLNPLFGLNSGVFTPSSTGNALQSDLLVPPIGFYGRKCSAEFTYRYPSNSVDSSTPDFKVDILKKEAGNSTENVISTFNIQETGTLTGKFTSIFDCPSEDDTPLRIRIESLQGTATFITVDRFFVGYGRQTVDVGASAVTLETSGIIHEGLIAENPPGPISLLVTGTTNQTVTQSNLTMDSVRGDMKILCADANTTLSTNTCSGSSEHLGFGFTPNQSGTYEVCMTFPHKQVSQNGDGVSTFHYIQRMDGAGAVIDYGRTFGNTGGYDSASGSNDFYNSVEFCNFFDLQAGVDAKFRYAYQQFTIGGTPSILEIPEVPSTPGNGQYNVRVSAKNVTEQFPTPVFTDLVDSLANKVSSTDNDIRIEHAKFNQTTGAFNQFGSDWINSAFTLTTGVTSISLNPTKFSEVPSCVVTSNIGASGITHSCFTFNGSLTNLQVGCEPLNTSNGNGINSDYHLICVGKK